MATMTVSLPDQMKDWIEQLTESGEYASSSDYVRDLVRRDRERRDQKLTLDELRQIIDEAKAAPVSEHTVADIFAEARQQVAARQGRARG